VLKNQLQDRTMSNTAPLVAAYLDAKAAAHAASAALEAAKSAILATGLETLTDGHVDVVVCLSERATLDAKIAKSYLDAAQIAAATKKAVVTTVRVQARLAVAA
jgi:hypothetical protein